VSDDPIPAIKRKLADEILALANQTNMFLAARRMGIDVARMSNLRRGRVARFSVERLIRILATVDRRVDLNVVATNPRPIRWSGRPADPYRLDPRSPGRTSARGARSSRPR
jgi:predicted XRE-type DNA-binding protein